VQKNVGPGNIDIFNFGLLIRDLNNPDIQPSVRVKIKRIKVKKPGF
jgi:hypothetical protein